jgi:hypothetical protein
MKDLSVRGKQVEILICIVQKKGVMVLGDMKQTQKLIFTEVRYIGHL